MTVSPEPLFIDAPDRRLFGLFHPAASDKRGSVLMLPPFAEEMNMSRRMGFLAGEAISGAGYDFLNLDLTGTGESSGDFEDASWNIWQEDARLAAGWLSERSGTAPITLGLRMGGLLAASMDGTEPLILWQPVGNGETMLNQFLRIRIAAGMTGASERETTKGLREEWRAGHSVEVAGYTVSPALAEGLDGARLVGMPVTDRQTIFWLETGDEERGPSPASQRTIDEWQEENIPVRTKICAGDPFWTIQETTIAPDLISATVEALLSL